MDIKKWMKSQISKFNLLIWQMFVTNAAVHLE